MKNLRRNKKFKIMAGVLVLLMSIFFLAPHQLVAKGCIIGLARCSIDAIIVAIFGGLQSGALYFSGCLIGYTWCLEYFD